MDALNFQIRSLVIELSARGSRTGHVEVGTQRRADALRIELVKLYNAELVDNPETRQRFSTSRGVIFKGMISHLMAAVYGAGQPTAGDQVMAIQRAVEELPKMCDLLARLNTTDEKQAETVQAVVADSVHPLLDKRDHTTMEIAGDSSRSLDEKMRSILAINPKSYQWNSIKWAEVLKVSDSRIRQSDTWRSIRQNQSKCC